MAGATQAARRCGVCYPGITVVLKFYLKKESFQMFRIHELTANMRAADCMMHTRRVAAFRKLPPKYPLGQKWTADDS